MRTQPSNHRLSTTPPPEVDYAALPGKLLILFLCIVPFFILNIAVNPSAMERALYWMGANAACSDYETYPREWILIGIASLTAVWFVLERFVLRRPSRTAAQEAIREESLPVPLFEYNGFVPAFMHLQRCSPDCFLPTEKKHGWEQLVYMKALWHSSAI